MKNIKISSKGLLSTFMLFKINNYNTKAVSIITKEEYVLPISIEKSVDLIENKQNEFLKYLYEVDI